MRIFRQTHFDFLAIRRRMYVVSAVIISSGIISLIFKGVNYGIDFRGGTELVLAFDQKPEIGQLRNALDKVGLGNSEIKSLGDEKNVLIRTAIQGEGTVIGNKIKAAIQEAYPNSKFEVLKGYKISAKIGEELRRDAIYAVIVSLLAILLYIAVRFKFVFGLGAVAALFHDTLLTIGIISIADGLIPGLNLEITQEIVAAFLTLLGVSNNDTIVVFDRIRENLKLYRSMSLYEVMNKSLNETLSRTIITSGTIFVVLLVLLFVGGEVTRGFAFTMTIGILTGTYSSIYIASAFVLEWSERKKSESV
ncbi:MAG TPA: protein translocase subunit SecF [Bacteroidota bacterium]|nr:protein translocase subunit SecF [Bacteroidota bacterium]